MERTRIFSETPGTPGRNAHTPRTMRRISTPAFEASQSAAMIAGSSSAFILAMICAAPSLGDLYFVLDGAQHLLVQRKRRLPQMLEFARLSKPGQLNEHVVDVGADFLVCSEEPEIGIELGGSRVIIPGR